jgi:hypothetical protein
MTEVSRYLFLSAAIPFLVLGIAHALATPLRADARKGLSPADPELARAMSRTSVRLTRRTDMWRAWVGFNFSHSLGAVVFAAVVLLAGRSEASFRADGPLLIPLGLVVSGVYLALASRYWFRTPIAGCALSCALFLASWVVSMLGG